MSEVPGGDADASPNLTPILDMVFQLITFFMLVINFKSAALDLNLKLPVMGSAKLVDSSTNNDLLVLNVLAKEGKLTQYGSEVDAATFIKNEARVSKMASKKTDEQIEKEGFDTIVVIRADQNTPFRYLYRVLKTCQDEGFRSFALRAMNRTE